MAAEPPKKRPPFRSSSMVVSAPAEKKSRVATSVTVVPEAQTSGVNLRIQQARNFAVAQAQEDGATGNFKIFDSPFGNFLVPVVPTRAEVVDSFHV